MNFVFNIATLNLNSINTDINKSLLKDFITKFDIDVAFLQEVAFDNFSFLPSYTSLINISIDRKGTGVLIKDNIDFHSFVLDPSGRIISVVINDINFVNVYAHSGTNKKREREDLFLNQMTVHLSKTNCMYSVMLGDFNCILEPNDSNSSIKNVSKGLRTLVNAFNFKDIASEKKSANFTFYRGPTASRLDRIYGNQEFLDRVRQVSTVGVPCSDHHAVVLKIGIQPTSLNPRGRGYWKINSSLLSNPEISQRFRTEYGKLKSRLSYMDHNSWWNHAVKAKIRSFYKNESWKSYQSVNQQKDALYAKLQTLTRKQHAGENTTEQINLVKMELMEFEHKRLENLRSKIKDPSLIEGERLSIVQVSKQLHHKDPISKSNPEANGDRKINLTMSEVHQHFSTVFSQDSENVTDQNHDPLSSIQKQLNIDEANTLIRYISQEEILGDRKSVV